MQQANNLPFQSTKFCFVPEDVIDNNTGYQYVSAMTGNFYARYLNGNIKNSPKGIVTV